MAHLAPVEAEVPAADAWPRITLVTPVRNSARYLEDAIRSVVEQGYPNLEYIVVDGASTDGSVDIIRRYADRLTLWVSEPDRGMYDALNKGFARSTGEILGWLSATDVLHRGSLSVAGGVFRTFPDVEWITGIPTFLSDDGMLTGVGEVQRWSRLRFLAGANRYIQQESTFWRRSLWRRAGGSMDASRRLAGDFELWVRFFRHARLYPVEALIGGFRVHEESLGIQTLAECHRIHDEVVARELRSVRGGTLLRVFRAFGARAMQVPLLRGLWWRLAVKALYHQPGPDWPPVIRHDGRRWVMR